MNKGDHDRALADYNEAIRLDPKGALIFRDRGDAYVDKGDPERSHADYDAAIRDLTPTMLSLFAIEEERNRISTTRAVVPISRKPGSWTPQLCR
jgi:tetratricopeptide (TPR) repeat protein